MVRIAIEGNIGSGKSALLARLRTIFPDAAIYTEPVDTDAEWAALLKLHYEDPKAYSLPFQVRVLLSHLNAGRESASCCISERSPVSARLVFAHLLKQSGYLTDEEHTALCSLDSALGWAPDFTIFIACPAEICQTRIQQRGREAEKTLNDDIVFLRRVEYAYESMLKMLVPVREYVRVDGTRPLDEVVSSVSSTIANMLILGMEK